MSDERIGEERLKELASRGEVGSLHPYAKQLDEYTLVARELLALRASHAELVKALESYPSAPDICVHDDEPDICPSCKYDYETDVESWFAVRTSVLENAAKFHW